MTEMAVNSGNILRPGRVVRMFHETIQDGFLADNWFEGEVVTMDSLGVWLKSDTRQEVMIPWGRVIKITHERKGQSEDY